MAKQNVTVYINEKFQYFIEESSVNSEALQTEIQAQLKQEKEGTVVLRSDKTVPVQYVVTVIDAVNKINEINRTKHKVILATQPLKENGR